VVVDVEVREHHSLHISWANPQAPQLWPDFVIGFDPEHDLPSHVGMERFAGLQEMRPLARVHHDHAFRVIDDPHKRRKPVRPVTVREYRESSTQPAPSSQNLCGLDADPSGLDRVDLHTRSTIDRTIAGWSK